MTVKTTQEKAMNYAKQRSSDRYTQNLIMAAFLAGSVDAMNSQAEQLRKERIQCNRQILQHVGTGSRRY